MPMNSRALNAHQASASPTSVYVIEPDCSSRQSLVDLCASVALTARPFERPGACLGELDDHSRGCVVMNVWLPEMTGLQLQQTFREKRIHLPLIMITSRPDVPTAVQALKHGAFDFLESNCSPQLLLDRIFRAIEWDAAHSAEQARLEAVRTRLSQLTLRERQILHLLVEGKTTKETAGHLGLSAKTVENHRARIMDKMESHNFASLIRNVYFGTQDDLILANELVRRPEGTRGNTGWHAGAPSAIAGTTGTSAHHPHNPVGSEVQIELESMRLRTGQQLRSLAECS